MLFLGGSRFGRCAEFAAFMFILSAVVIKICSNGGNGGAPWWSYWSAGITNTIGPAMEIEAFKYSSYPAQVLVKYSKMIPGYNFFSPSQCLNSKHKDLDQ